MQINTSTMARGTTQSPSAFHALEFNLKVSSGIYSKEKVKCFCGSKKHVKLTDKDRYGINYNLCLCKNCGILYSNPRLTNESFRYFYENDYRNIYSDRGEVGDIDTGIKQLIDDTLENYELEPLNVIFEIGCGTGATLQQFRGCDCIGVDYDESAIKIAKSKFMNVKVGGIEVLEQTGKKANLIIMNHVLEHMTDIESDLKRIRNLLSDNGILYIAVPGLYMGNINSLVQNAHNYQFNANTMLYMMMSCGFEEFYLDESIQSVWGKCEKISKKDSLKYEYKYIESYLLKKDNKHIMPSIRMTSKFQLKDIRANMINTIKSGFPEITELVNINPDSEAILISGGPSVNKYINKIKKMQSDGMKIYAIERMYQWCLSHNIVPDYIVALDASDDVIESFTSIHKDTTHIIVSNVKKDVLNSLKGHKVYYYNLKHKGINYSKMYNGELDRLTFIQTGSSVSLCNLNIAMTLGARKIHMFGFDCHVTKQNYADGITGVGDIQETFEMEIDGKVFRTTSQYYAFMTQFFEMYQIGKLNGMLEKMLVYGDSMAKAASKIDIDGDKKGK